MQIYRNYTQFKQNEAQLVADIQQSLDNALEVYFADLAKTDVITLTENRTSGFMLKSERSADSDSLEIKKIRDLNKPLLDLYKSKKARDRRLAEQDLL